VAQGSEALEGLAPRPGACAPDLLRQVALAEGDLSVEAIDRKAKEAGHGLLGVNEDGLAVFVPPGHGGQRECDPDEGRAVAPAPKKPEPALGGAEELAEQVRRHLLDDDLVTRPPETKGPQALLVGGLTPDEHFVSAVADAKHRLTAETFRHLRRCRKSEPVVAQVGGTPPTEPRH